MKVCIVAEGCYPYVVGGVSSWIHSMIRSFPNLEFQILAIISNRSLSGKFAYELPENVTQVHEKLSAYRLFGFPLDDAFHLSAAVFGAEEPDPESGSVSLCGNRVCRCTGKYGEIFVWL